MGWIYYNPNQIKKDGGDCVIRALCALLNIDDWEKMHKDLCDFSRLEGDMPSSNDVWIDYLKMFGYQLIPISERTTIRDYARNNPYGKYMLGTGDHVVTVIDGNYMDSYDSGYRVPIYSFRKEQINGRR